MRHWADDLERYTPWRKPADWSMLTEQSQTRLIVEAVQTLRRESPDHPLWKLRPRMLRDVPVASMPRLIARRHCIYHVYAAKQNDIWRRNVAALVSRAAAFDGVRLAAIACDGGSHTFDESSRLLRAAGWRCFEFANDPQLREVVSFLPLLVAVRNECGPDDAIFYAHTKGNTTSDGVSGAEIWRNSMYSRLLSDWREAMQLLESRLFVGCHLMRWPQGQSPFPSGLSVGQWMLAGTFYWFRADVFHHQRWRQVPIDRYGAEAWPSIVAQAHEAASMYQVWDASVYPTPSPYDPMTYPAADRLRFADQVQT